jgi:type II secretory ATPase GspE/PulE/Tfp pilus assembly ATPase PilB-like protein
MEASKDQAQKSPEYEKRLNEIYRNIHEEDSFEKVLPKVEKGMLSILEAERLTVYQRGRHDREIVSRYKTGDEIKEFRLPLSPTSIASFVALSQKSLCIGDVYDKKALASIHPKLKFDDSFDKRSGFHSKSMVVVPIKFKNTMLGVMQIINRVDGGAFTDLHLKHALELSQVIGQKFQYDMQATQGPFDYLLHRKKITPEKLEELKQKAAKEKVSVAQVLITDAKLLPEEVGESLERYYQVPFFKYDPEIELPSGLLKRVKTVYLRTHLWVPIAGDEEKAVILIDDPNDTNRIMEIQQVLGARTYELRVGIKEDILRFLGVGVETVSDSEGGANLEDLIGRMESEIEVEEEDVSDAMSSVSENEATVVQLVNRMIVDATKMNASDIHVEPSKGKTPAVVRMRVDGVCREVLKIPASHIAAVLARIKIISRLDIAERRKPQDGKITAKFHKKPIELRVATIPTVNGESAVLRVLASGGVLPFDKLNLSQHNYDETKRLIAHPHGIFLVVGPTGSGKTTTLHAILGDINTPDRKIWTAEDPVEITQPRLQQVQVQPKIGFTFAAAMRSFLRADPDVILIGEMRDQETCHIGIEASLTGHLVFSTLHTNSASETITRLLDLGLDPLNFADAFLGVLAQRLVRTLCSECKEAYKPSDEIQLRKPVGCDKCGKTGYKGRTGIHELLISTPEMKKLIVRKSEVSLMRELAMKEGMRTLVQDGIMKVLKGQTDQLQLRMVTAE